MTETEIESRLRLTLSDNFPKKLLDIPATDLWKHLEGPTLFRIEGRREPPLFVSVLLHGNEHTGWRAMQSLLRRHQDAPLPRSLLLFVGNIEAAKANVRTLPSQNDYNRVWPGSQIGDVPEARVMREVFETVKAAAPFASIDVHNNTGNNPHYACVTTLADSHLNLARLFGRTVVFFERPLGVQTGAFSTICPSATVECGRSLDAAGDEHVAEFVSAALHLSEWPRRPVPEEDLDLMRTFAIVKVPQEASFSFDGSEADFRLRADLDRLNFSELEPGAAFGALGGDAKQRLQVLPAGDFAGMEEYFDYPGGEIVLSQSAIPAMLTLDPQAVRLDSLGYLMHRIDRDGGKVG